VQVERFADAGAQVVDAQVDGPELAEALQPLLRRFVHVARADGRHHGQPAHRVEPRADHAAVQAVECVVADEFALHGDVADDAFGLQAGDLQAQHLVEHDPLLEDLLQAGDEILFEDNRRRRRMARHSPSCLAARSFMISSAPPPIIITFTSR
jgi:hypothetical protein